MPVGGGGFAKFMTNTKQDALPINSATITSQDAGVSAALVAAMQEILPFQFLLLLLATIGVVFHVPQICGCKQFWKNCFTQCRWWYPPSQWKMDVLNFIVNIHWVIVISRFLWEAQTEALEAVSNTYYFGIFMLIMAALVIRYWYIILFFNYHKKWWALMFSIIFAVLEVVATLILTILLGFRHSWIAFGFSIPILIWSVIVLSWTVTVYRCFSSGTCRPWAPKQESKQIIDEQPKVDDFPMTEYGNSLLSTNSRARK